MAAANPNPLINGRAKLSALVTYLQGCQRRSLLVVLVGQQGAEGHHKLVVLLAYIVGQQLAPKLAYDPLDDGNVAVEQADDVGYAVFILKV